VTRPSGFRHVEVGHIEGKPGVELLAAPLGGCRRWRLRGGSACRPKALQATPLQPLPTRCAGAFQRANTRFLVQERFGLLPERTEKSVRRFGAFTQDLQELVKWLLECGVRSVAMESTRVYWIPLLQLLEEAGLKVCLVNARHVKNVPGRKSDVRDCQWLQYLHSVGLLLGCASAFGGGFSRCVRYRRSHGLFLWATVMPTRAKRNSILLVIRQIERQDRDELAPESPLDRDIGPTRFQTMLDCQCVCLGL
jgi:hypothetical protein